MQKFSQKIFRVGGDWCVDLPPAVTAAFGKKGPLPVVGTLNGVPIYATLAPQGKDRHRLYITEKMKRETGVKLGDLVELALDLDTGETNKEDVLPELEAALASRPVAKAKFNAMPVSYKKQILNYLHSIRADDALRENIDKLLVKLEQG